LSSFTRLVETNITPSDDRQPGTEARERLNDDRPEVLTLITSYTRTTTTVLLGALACTAIALGLSIITAVDGSPLVPDQLMMGVWSVVSITWCWRIRLSASATSTWAVLGALRPILARIEDDERVDNLLAELDEHEYQQAHSNNVFPLRPRRRRRRRPSSTRDTS
jgi:hypothetical protein